MFPRSERFVEKIEITPGPNHYDVKLNDDDPYKRFGFLGKTKRFNENNKEGGPGPYGVAGGSGLYGRSSHSSSLPSLVIDDDAASIDTASIHSNSSNTPDRVKRPPTSRSKSSDKLGAGFGANSNKAEERLKKELADLTERFERYRIARQKDLDVISEKQRKAELMYQGAIKDKNSIQTQLAAKESEIADLGARHSILKASLEKSEKAAALVSDKIGKGAALQKRIDELERLLSRTKLSLEEQESYVTEAKQKLDHERQQFQSQLSEQKEAAEQESLRAIEQQKQTEQLYNDEIRKSKDESDAWRIKFEELERQVKELEQKLEAERRTVEELRETMKNEREQLQGEIDQANQKIQSMELERSQLESISKEAEDRLQREKDDLDQQLQKANKDYEELSMKHQATERALKEDRARHTEAVETMTRQYDEQQAHFSKERQENLKARQDLEQSIAFLINELGQNRDALLKVQSARAQLQDMYDQSQLELKNMSENLKALEGQHEQLQAAFKNEQEAWTAKYEALSSASTSQKRESEATISELQMTLEKKNEEHLRVMQNLEATQSELRAVESQREEIIALRAEEERKAAETRGEVVRLEQENSTVSQQLATLGKSHEALIAELDQVKSEVQAKEQSVKSLESEIELTVSEAKERESQYQNRIKDLEDRGLVDTKEIEMFQEKQKIWESDRAKLGEEAASRREEIEQYQNRIKDLEDRGLVDTKEIEMFQEKQKIWESDRAKLGEEAANRREEVETLQSKLDKANVEREIESKASAERINDLEARCHAMESAFKEMFGKSGSVQEIDLSQPNEIWKQHSTAILDVLLRHTSQCSISKAEYAALLEEKSAIEKASTSLRETLDSQEDAFKRAHDDHSGLLAKIAELEDQIRHLKAQIEFLEADNIGKEAIIKALQDEYEYQEKIIRDLSKNEDATKEVTRLEEELRVMTNRIRETDEWIKEVQEDNKKYREAYVKADIAREETLLDMAKLHEELAESEQARLQVQNQLQVEVSALIKKNGLSSNELSRLSKMDVDSAQNLSLKQKVKQVAQLKEEILVLKKKNLGLSNTRDSLRLKCLQVERDLEAYMAANASGATIAALSAGNRQTRTGSISGSSVVSSSSVSASTDTITSSPPALDQVPSGKLQLQGLTPVTSPARSRSTSTSSSGTPKLKQTGSSVNTKTPIKSRAARSFLAGHSTTS